MSSMKGLSLRRYPEVKGTRGRGEEAWRKERADTNKWIGRYMVTIVDGDVSMLSILENWTLIS